MEDLHVFFFAVAFHAVRKADAKCSHTRRAGSKAEGAALSNRDAEPDMQAPVGPREQSMTVMILRDGV